MFLNKSFFVATRTLALVKQQHALSLKIPGSSRDTVTDVLQKNRKVSKYIYNNVSRRKNCIWG